MALTSSSGRSWGFLQRGPASDGIIYQSGAEPVGAGDRGVRGARGSSGLGFRATWMRKRNGSRGRGMWNSESVWALRRSKEMTLNLERYSKKILGGKALDFQIWESCMIFTGRILFSSVMFGGVSHTCLEKSIVHIQRTYISSERPPSLSHNPFFFRKKIVRLLFFSLL